MPLSYQQQKDLSRVGMQTGKSVLEKLIIFSAEFVKALANFIGRMISQAVGK